MKCRLFLENSQKKLKKIYSIKKLKTSILVHVNPCVVIKDFGLPPDSEIHYIYASNGTGSHLSLKYKDYGPFSNGKIMRKEHYLKAFFGNNNYEHKELVFYKKHQQLRTKGIFPLKENNKIKYLLPYSPPSFSKYENERKTFHFTTFGMPLLNSQEEGNATKDPPSNSDIIINELEHMNTRINVCGFVCSKNYYAFKNEDSHKIRVCNIPSFPDYGISLIFS